MTKWPFYVADAFLVGLAVIIALLNGWQLNGIQVFACVLAVALGAAFLTLPFVTEFLMFAREEKEDRAAELRLLKKQLESLEAVLLKQHGRLDKLETRSGLDDQRYELLTSAIDQKQQAAHPDLSDLMERIKKIETAETKTTKVSTAVDKELESLNNFMEKTNRLLDALQKRVNTLEEETQKYPATDPAPIKETDKTKDEAVTSEKSHSKTETRLLKRAIQEKQDTASKAVSRIIDPENKSTQSDSQTETESSSKTRKSKKPSKHEPMTTEKPETDSAQSEIYSDIEELPDDFSVSLSADLMVDDDLFDMEEVSGSKKSPTQKEVASEKTNSESTARQLITATVEVNKLMGIGNKPFLRGSSAGLSWEKGVEMEFQEIGKWTWSVEIPENETIELQVYCNDEDADRRGKFTLTAGQKLEIKPKF